MDSNHNAFACHALRRFASPTRALCLLAGPHNHYLSPYLGPVYSIMGVLVPTIGLSIVVVSISGCEPIAFRPVTPREWKRPS